MPAPMNILALDTFLEAFRDAGYRGLSGALSELVDNALEAEASQVDIRFHMAGDKVNLVTVLDNGCGITPSELTLALQLGGTTRFDSRLGLGRYGIGLPGSSISQARRVDVYSWIKPELPWWSFLSLDHIKDGILRNIPTPSMVAPPISIPAWATSHGTLVVWSTCDRVEPVNQTTRSTLIRVLGRTFRKSIWAGCELRVDGEVVKPIDPLFLQSGTAPAEAVQYGPPLVFAIEILERGRRRQSEVTVRFSELPIESWTSLPNLEKRRLGISKGGGVSVLRANREIDSGWFFMGEKRKESYDDWWRCEVCFEPELDESFGVTHTKQGIHPRIQLSAILTPELERVAHVLNGRVRQRFQEIRRHHPPATRATTRAGLRDNLLEPPKGVHIPPREVGSVSGLRYEIVHRAINGPEFFQHKLQKDILQLTLNTDHPFYTAMLRLATEQPAIDLVEFLLLAAARAERRLKSTSDRAALSRHREHWSNTLLAFLT